jgi:hypothetical protein
MRRDRLAVAAAVLALASLAVAAPAQEAGAVYQQAPKKGFAFAGDGLTRYEWTREIPTADGLVNEDRYLVQVRPRIEMRFGPVELGVGGAFNYSADENDLAPPGLSEPLLVRDNYRSQDARLDLAYGKITAGPVVAQGGRFLMPLPLTEMIWDRDLRPQGGAVALQFAPQGSFNRFALHGIYATGSHVFEDESVMYGGALELAFGSASGSGLQLVGSYLQFDDLDGLQVAIRRQNSRLEGLLFGDYQVVDVVARLTRGGQVPLQLVGNYCWNIGRDEANRGLWLAAVMGELPSSRARLEYTYAKVDKDATLAAFSTDDFFWGTGWEGHRADLGTGTGRTGSVHGIAQWQRFKDSPNPAAREEWVTRYRVEWRVRF